MITVICKNGLVSHVPSSCSLFLLPFITTMWGVWLLSLPSLLFLQPCPAACVVSIPCETEPLQWIFHLDGLVPHLYKTIQMDFSLAWPVSSSRESFSSLLSLSPSLPLSIPSTGSAKKMVTHFKCVSEYDEDLKLNWIEEISNCVSRVKEGNVAIYFSNGALLEEIAGPGVHWSTPFVTTVHQVPTNLFKSPFTKIILSS